MKRYVIALGYMIAPLLFLASCALGPITGPGTVTYPPCNVASQWHVPAGNIQLNDLEMVGPDEGWITGNTAAGIIFHLVQGQLVQPPRTLPNTPLSDLSMGSPTAGWAVPTADFLGEVDYAPLMRYSQGQWHLFDIPALDKALEVGSLMPMSVQMVGPNAAWLFAVIGTPQDPNNPDSRTGVIILRDINGVWT